MLKNYLCYKVLPVKAEIDTFMDNYDPEENILYDILCVATENDDYPVFEIQPCGSDYIYAYTIIEIEEQFNTDFYNFCWEAVKKIAYDLGLLY